MNHYTSFKQSKKLAKLGLDSSTADMCYESMGKGLFKHDPIVIDKNYLLINDVPCWSFGALIELMPDYIAVKENLDGIIRNVDSFLYFVKPFFMYRHFTIYTNRHVLDFESESPNLIDSAVETIVWLLKNNYIKK